MAALQRSLEGGYRLLRLLGRGGMGAVYLARDLSLDRLVAIKVLHQDRALPPQALERFRREARTAARLTHPNIVPLHGIGEVSGMPYFVMGYVAGESMGARLQREGRLAVEPAVRMLGEIADALDYAHRQGVVHRDVKPENVMLEAESGRALLSDFGLAKAIGVDSTMSSGHVLGTPHYMSPEQSAGAPIDERSDVYSLGVMAYRMLSGRLPFQSSDLRELLLKHIHEAPPPLEEQVPGLPGPLVAAIQRSMAKNPVQRWPDMRAFRAAIRGDVAGDAVLYARLAGHGPILLSWLAASTALLAVPSVWYFASATVISDVNWGAKALAWTVALFALLAYGSHVIRALERARAVGFTWAEIGTAVFRQPRWWHGPYPKRLRWPGDLWPRLPRAVKIVRSVSLVPVLILFLIVPVIVVAARPSAPEGQLIAAVALTVVGFLTSLLLVAIAVALTPHGQDLLCWLPTMEPERWRDALVARRLLSASTPAAVLTEPQQHVQAIDVLAQEISGPARPAAEEAAFIARRLIWALAELEREAAEMARHADEDEVVRLEHRLAALGAGSAGETTETAELRRLMERQLDLLRPMGGRVEAARVRRERLRGLLSQLHGELAQVRQAIDLHLDAWREPAARLGAVCREATALVEETRAAETMATRTRDRKEDG